MTDRDSNVTKALIVWGGWDGHEPAQVTAVFAAELRRHGVKAGIVLTP